MFRVITFLLLSALFVSSTSAQQLQTIRGNVVDIQSRSPLVGASIVLLESNPLIGTISDADGNFRLENVPVGRQSLRISYLGYKEVVLNNLIVNSGKEVIINVEMEEEVLNGTEVIITGKEKGGTNNELVSVSGRTFSIDETNRFAGSLGDPSRMASNFAGVAGGGNDQRNDIIIRGNSPLGMLWRLEGADIPNPNHFSNQGANGGPVSILNNNTLANSDFLTGAWPAEYGAATSGVFDLKMRNGNNEKREHTFQIGFNGVELMTEGPIKKGGASYLFSYRYSTLAFFDAIGFKFGESGLPYYQDFSLKVNVPTKKAGNFGLWALGGISSTNIFDSELDSVDRMEKVRPQDIEFASGMFAAGITHLIPLNKKGYLKTVVAVSKEQNRTTVDTLFDYSSKDKALFFSSASQVWRNTLHSFYNHKFNSRHALKAGIILTRYQTQMDDSTSDWRENTSSGFRINYAFDEEAVSGQAYINWNYRISSRLTLNSGLHAQGLLINSTGSIEPRVGLRYEASSKMRLSFAYGLHGQGQPIPVYFQKTLLSNNESALTNKELKFTKNHHFVLGMDRSIGKHYRIKVETYYQYLTQIPVTQNPSFYSVVNFGADFGGLPNIDSLVSEGQGRNYGLEVTFERFFSKGFYMLATASLFESEYLASDGVWRNTAFNSNYVFNVLAGKEWELKKNSTLSINIKGTYAGGRREIPILLEESINEKRAVYDFDNAYNARLADYSRIDIRIGYKMNRKRLTHEWALDLRNVLNTQNLLTRQFDPATGTQKDVYQIGIFPVPLYRLQF